jgi:hypothetical protein
MPAHRRLGYLRRQGLRRQCKIGASWRRGWYGTGLERTRGLTLAAAAQQRTAEAQGAEAAFSPYVPAEPDENTPIRPGAGQGLLPDTACSASERQE